MKIFDNPLFKKIIKLLQLIAILYLIYSILDYTEIIRWLRHTFFHDFQYHTLTPKSVNTTIRKNSSGIYEYFKDDDNNTQVYLQYNPKLSKRALRGSVSSLLDQLDDNVKLCVNIPDSTYTEKCKSDIGKLSESVTIVPDKDVNINGIILKDYRIYPKDYVSFTKLVNDSNAS